MNTIKTLVLKDIYEYKNDYRKLIFSFFMYIGLPVIAFSYSKITLMNLGDVNFLIEIFIIIATTFIYIETTLAPIRRSIRNGVFEKYYISSHVKTIEIFASKYILNLLVSFTMLIIIFVSNFLLGEIIGNGISISITPRIIIIIIFSCCIGTCLAFINSLLFADERSSLSYVISIAITYLCIYKLIDLFNLSSIFIVLVIQLIISLILVKVVLTLLNNNRFIKR